MSPFAWKFVKIVTVDLEQEGTNMNYEELLDQLRVNLTSSFLKQRILKSSTKFGAITLIRMLFVASQTVVVS